MESGSFVLQGKGLLWCWGCQGNPFLQVLGDQTRKISDMSYRVAGMSLKRKKGFSQGTEWVFSVRRRTADPSYSPVLLGSRGSVPESPAQIHLLTFDWQQDDLRLASTYCTWKLKSLWPMLTSSLIGTCSYRLQLEKIILVSVSSITRSG